jgi:hypothetical protein
MMHRNVAKRRAGFSRLRGVLELLRLFKEISDASAFAAV